LGDEHAVEWIFMWTWKRSCANAVLDGYGDNVELLSCQVKHEILDHLGGNIELTQANLRGHFPRRSSRRRTPLLHPALQFFRREGFEEFGTNMNFALQGAGLAIATRLSDGDELNYRLIPAGYDDFFASASFLDEAGKLSFRFVNGDRFHGSV
jgi:hypothetical protein